MRELFKIKMRSETRRESTTKFWAESWRSNNLRKYCVGRLSLSDVFQNVLLYFLLRILESIFFLKINAKSFRGFPK